MCTRPDAAGRDQKSVSNVWLINWFQSRKELWPRIDTDETRFRRRVTGSQQTSRAIVIAPAGFDVLLAGLLTSSARLLNLVYRCLSVAIILSWIGTN